MLEQVAVPPLSLDAYAPVAGDEAVAEIRALAADLQGARVLHVNATKFGGGVAEILPTLTARASTPSGGSSPARTPSSTSRSGSTTGSRAPR